MKDIDKKRDEFLKLAAEIRSANAASNPDAIADLTARLDAMQAAQGKESAEASRGALPETAKETAQATKDREVRALEGMLSLYKKIEDESIEARAKIAELEKRLGAEKDRRVDFANGEAGKRAFSKEDYEALLVEPTNNEQVRDMQRAADVVSYAQAFLRAGHVYNHDFFGGKRDIREFKSFDKLAAKARALYTTGSGAGDEFIPTTLSSQVFEQYEMERKLESAFPRLEMPAGEWKIPVSTTNPTFYLQAQSANADATNYLASDPGTSSQTLTAAKLACRVVWADEFDEDSIAAVAPFIQGKIGKAAAEGVENALVNGDTTSTHFDTGYTVAAHDQRRLCIGIREAAITTSMTADLSTWSLANIAALLAGCGEMAADLQAWVMVPSVEGYLKDVIADSNFTTAQLLPPGFMSTNVSGAVGVAYGMQVVPSGKLAVNLNSSGIYDGSSTAYTACCFVRPDQWLIGYRRGMTIEVQKDILNGQFNMVSTMRLHPKKMANASTGYSEAYGYKI